MTGAVVWGLYSCTRLGVVVLVAARMRRDDDAVHSITRGLIGAGARLRPAMSALAVAAGSASAVWSGI